MVQKPGIHEFIEASKKLMGRETSEPSPVNTVVDRTAITMFSAALGSDNPLFNDPDHAANSRYGCLIAPQTFLAAIRYPTSEGAYSMKDYSLAKFVTATEFEWFDVVRCGDTCSTELKLADIYEKPYWNQQKVAHLVSEGLYWNQHNELVGKGVGTVSMIPFQRGEELLVNRDIYVYSEREIARIVEDIEAEESRGGATRYWEEVEEGDQLPQVVKGPVSLPDIIAWRQATANVDYTLEAVYRRALKEPGNTRINPTTNWPYWHADLEREDHFSCQGNGMPQPWIHGLHRVCLAEDLLVKWMSDDSFLRRLNVDILHPMIYGDTNWYRGTVVNKYKERLKGTTYQAVDVTLEGINQLNQKTATGEATIYLPSKGQPINLPVLH